MKHNVTCRLAAALMALVLCLGALTAMAESASQPTEQPTPKVTMTPEEKQAQGVLTVGAKGDEVTRMQQRLKDLGYLSGKVDGQYGGGTRRAVISFQRRNGLSTDGVAGEETLAKLYAEDAVAAPENTGPVDVLAGDVPMLVNKENTVDEFFVPADLVQLNKELSSKLVKIKYKKTRGVRTAVEALKTMLEAAKADGITKWQISAGYRTWGDQVSMLNSKTNSYLKHNKGWSRSKARRAAMRTVAEAGCSEHHLGLAFDINVPGASNFSSTKQSAWLNKHCWEYGFIIRYTKEKEEITGFEAEPWHIRYVGVNHAMYMKQHNLCLEEYVQGINDGSIQVPTDEETKAALAEGSDDAETEDGAGEDAESEGENPGAEENYGGDEENYAGDEEDA